MKKKLDYALISVFISTICLPLVVQGIVIGVTFQFASAFLAMVPIFVFFTVVCLVSIIWVGRYVARLNLLPDDFWWRYGILFIPVQLVLILWVVALFVNNYQFSGFPDEIISLVLLPWFYFNKIFSLKPWGMVIVPVIAQLCFILGIYWGARRYHTPLKRITGLKTVLGVTSLLLIVAGGQAWVRSERYITEDVTQSVREERNWYNLFTPLVGESQLTLKQAPPEINGAEALYQLYASALHSLYPGKDLTSLSKYRSPEAWESLITEQSDIIFVTQPSEKQKQRAREAGVTLKYTPVAREAFVFIAHRDNPVSSLTHEQVQAIYSGKVDNWDEVGGPNHKIITWQRPEDSGSQTTMLAEVMKGITMIEPRKAEEIKFNEGITQRAAHYQSSAGALGYTFLYYASRVDSHKRIKLLAVNGVTPTIETIRSGAYPFTVDVYMVTRETVTEDTQKLLEWFLSPQGQRLVQDVGYVPVNPVLSGE